MRSTVCVEIEGCGYCGGSHFCEVVDAANCEDVSAWSYCAGDMLPEGCECQDSWMDDGCDAGGDAEQMGCPAQPCDATNANDRARSQVAGGTGHF